MFKSILLLSLILLIAGGTWASPFSESLPNQTSHSKSLKEMAQVLFPTRLDGPSENPGFRLISGKRGSKNSVSLATGGLKRFPYLAPDRTFDLGVLSLPPTVATGNGGAFLSGNGHYLLPYHFRLEGQYSDFQSFSVNSVQDPQDYAKILRTSSLGIAYPLTSSLTLSGHYGVVKGQSGQESSSPFFGALYRMNTTTSISVSYADSLDESNSSAPQQNTSAELKIHF